MVKKKPKKNSGVRLSHLSTCSTKKDGSQQLASCNVQTPPGDPADSDAPAACREPQITGQSQLGFSDRVYLLASVIFQNNHKEKPAAQRLVNYGKERGLPLPEVKDAEMQRSAFELAFNVLKYQELLENIMIDSCFYLTQPMPDDQMSLVAVMLYDFQDRKFLPWERHGKEEVVQEVRDVENFLLRYKTKLAASLARCRIKHDLLSIECILPESVRKKQERSSSLPLYAWVNTLTSSHDEVQSALKSAGFLEVQSIEQLEGQAFCQDPHCGDTLVFPAHLKAQLYSTKLLSDHKLIIQDKSCSLGPNAVCSLLPEEGDVLMVGCFSGLTVCHTASLISEKHKANSNSQPTVFVCVSDCSDAQKEELQLAVSTTGCKNVKLIPEVFQSFDGGDKRLQKVRAILLMPKCSVSAVNNPVDFILKENGDTDLLQDLSQGSITQSKLESLVAQQRKDIDHALKFPKVSAVVYSTCSSYSEENVDVVSRALQQAKAHLDQEGEPKQANFRPGPSPFSSSDNAEDAEEGDSYFLLEPSEHSNGCFLAVLNKEPEPEVKEAPQEVIARANAKGILDRIGSNHLSRKEHHGNTNSMKKAAHARTSQPHLSHTVSSQSKSQQTKGSKSTILCGQQEFTSLRQSSQGKSKAQALKSSVPSSFSYSKQESTSSSSSSSSSSKPKNSTPSKSMTPVFNITNSTLTTPFHPHPDAPPATPVAPVVRSRRAHQEVLKPMVLVLPHIHFPSFFPPQHRQTRFSSSSSYNMRQTPTQIVSLSRSSRSLSKDAAGKSRPLF